MSPREARGMTESAAVEQAARLAAQGFRDRITAVAAQLEAMPRVDGVRTLELDVALVDGLTVLLRQLAERLPG